jgi:hypothetical protein
MLVSILMVSIGIFISGFGSQCLAFREESSAVGRNLMASSTWQMGEPFL